MSSRSPGPGVRLVPLLLAVLPAPFSAQASPPAAGQEPPAAPERVLQLSLADALEIALRNNFDLEIERLTTEEARYDAIGSWGAFDPLFGLSGSATKSESEPQSSIAGTEEDDLRVNSSLNLPFVTGGNFDLSYSRLNTETDSPVATFDTATVDVVTVALTQPLLRGAWRRFATSQQRALEIALERQLAVEREVRARVLLEVYQAYWNVVSAQEQLAVRELAVELGNQQLAQDQRRLEVGAGTEVDVLQAETNVAQREAERLQVDYTLREARDTLRRMLAPRAGADYDEFLDTWDWPIETLTPLPETSAEPLDWRASLHAALEQRPELAQRRLEIELAEVDLVRARSLRLPQLDLQLSSASAGLDSDPGDAFDKAIGWDFPSSSAALVFSIPVFNRSARNAEYSARTALRRARVILERAEIDVLADVRIATNEVDRQREAVVAAMKSRTLAQRQLEAEETRQEVGLSTTFQVLEFQEDLAQALSDEVAARAAYARALARLAFVEGRLEADLATPVGTGESEAR